MDGNRNCHPSSLGAEPLVLDRRRHRHPSPAFFQVPFALLPNAFDLGPERVSKGEREGRCAVLVAFSGGDRDLPALKVEVHHAQGGALQQPEARTVEQASHHDVDAGRIHGQQDPPGLRRGQDGRKAYRTSGADGLEIAQLGSKHVAVEEDQGIESVVLG